MQQKKLLNLWANKMSHSNISVFVPHIGCPCKCSFCNQFSITEQVYIPHENDVDKAVNIALASKKYDSENGEIAFFGGSFTAIDKDYMTELLGAAKKHIDLGHVKGIRISTRPDCINSKILDLLKAYGVTSIELGAQSMIDDVLNANNRGHNAESVYNASKLIKEYDFELGLQMMTGLYKDTDEGAKFTAKEFVKLKPDTVRIYPTIVLENTELERLFRLGEYKPQSVENAVELCSDLLILFEKNNIDVIRLGLHSIDISKYVAGPWHPAFSELCENKIYRDIISSHLESKGNYTVFVGKGELSKVIGQKKSNLKFFYDNGYNLAFKEDTGINARNIIIKGSE